MGPVACRLYTAVLAVWGRLARNTSKMRRNPKKISNELTTSSDVKPQRAPSHKPNMKPARESRRKETRRSTILLHPQRDFGVGR